mgnify:CR=1 FL=1
MKPCFNAIREQGERLECSSWCMRNRKNTRKSMRSDNRSSMPPWLPKSTCTVCVRVRARASAVASERVRMCPYMHARLSALGAARRSHAHGAARGTALSAWRSALGVTRGSIHFAPRSPHRGKKPRVAPHAYANQTPLRCSQINFTAPNARAAREAKKMRECSFPLIQIFRPCSPSLSDFPCSFGKSICLQTGTI